MVESEWGREGEGGGRREGGGVGVERRTKIQRTWEAQKNVEYVV